MLLMEPRPLFFRWVGLVAVLVGILAILAMGILTGAVLPDVGPTLRAPLALLLVASPFFVAIALRFPLFFFGIYAGFVPFENLKLLSGSLTISRIIAILAAGAILLAFLIRRRVEPIRRPLVVWGAVISWLLMTLMWCISTDYAMLTLTQEVQLFMLYGLVSLAPIKAKELRNLFILIIGAGVLSALYNIKIYSSYNPAAVHAGFNVGLTGAVGARNWAGVGGSAGDALDPNNYAAALLTPFVLMLYTMLSEKRVIWKLIDLGLFFSLVFGILTTASRGAFMAMGVVLTYLLLRSRYRLQLSVAAIGGFLVSLCLPALWKRIFDPTQGDGSGRFQIWSIAAEAFKRHWLGGAGVGNFQPAFDEAYSSVFQDPRFAVSRNMMSHNLIAGQSVELGIFGLLLLLFAWWTQWRALAEIPARSKLYDLRVALEALLLALFTASMFLDTMMRKYIWLAFSLVALTLTVWRHSPERKAAAKQESTCLAADHLETDLSDGDDHPFFGSELTRGR
jgi:hypothetical protein